MTDRLMTYSQGESIIAALTAINATLARIAAALESAREESGESAQGEESGGEQSGGE